MELPPTDPAALDRLKRFGGDKLLREMIALFLVAAPERIASARRADVAGDASGVEHALHSLKSSSAQLGAMRMERLSAQGEHLARGGSVQGLTALLTDLDEEHARVRQWLTGFRDGEAA
jgi:HPt (histidine-containing phosphotransfer) domain-containing protein